MRPSVLILLGKHAAESFTLSCGGRDRFADLLRFQGRVIQLAGLDVARFALPHPTAPYPGKSELYSQVFSAVGDLVAT